jgi:hypothetical protein
MSDKAKSTLDFVNRGRALRGAAPLYALPSFYDYPHTCERDGHVASALGDVDSRCLFCGQWMLAEAPEP